MVRFWVLGRFVIEADGVVVEPPRASRARSLLAWLVLNPGRHSRSRLAARFWPEVLDSSARASLRVALSELRSALDSAADCLTADRNQVGLVADRVWVDALAFAELDARGELEAALDLCRGELLPEIDDDWVLEARDVHTAAVVDVLERLASQREASGDLEAAISLSRRMVAIDPLGEAPTRELMRRLAAVASAAARSRPTGAWLSGSRASSGSRPAPPPVRSPTSCAPLSRQGVPRSTPRISAHPSSSRSLTTSRRSSERHAPGRERRDGASC